MEIQLSEDLMRFIETQVTGGRYPSHQDVVETALRRMRDQEPMPPRPRIPLAEGENDQIKIALPPPNESALTILRAVRKRREDRPASAPTGVQDYLREARSGGMYGHGDDARESTIKRND
jgi:putative addiction module CopG family antidote